jgi:hypothetical protein
VNYREVEQTIPKAAGLKKRLVAVNLLDAAPATRGSRTSPNVGAPKKRPSINDNLFI